MNNDELDEFKRNKNTPSHKLQNRGANRKNGKVDDVVNAEDELIITSAGSSNQPDDKPCPPVDRAANRYKDALGQLPREIFKAIVPPSAESGEQPDIDAATKGIIDSARAEERARTGQQMPQAGGIIMPQPKIVGPGTKIITPRQGGGIRGV